MCRPASFVVTKDRVFWSPNGDSHELIIAENELKESNIRSEIQFVRVEICPPGGDFRMPLEKWRYKTDQDRLPDWYVEPEEEKRVRAVLPDWLKEKVILPDQSVETVAGSVLAIYGKVKYICDSATVENICGSARVEYICDSARVKYIRDSARVKYIRDSAQVENICGSARVKYIGDSAQVDYICDSAQVDCICDSAQVEYICDSAQVKYIRDSAQVKSIRDSAQVENVSGKAVICTYKNLSPDILKSSKAVMIDRSNDTVVCYVGKD